jgi:hypothetical protein
VSTDNTSATQASPLRHGYVAIIDVLGWKGIWKRHSVAQVLEAVQIVRDAASLIDARTRSMFPSQPLAAIRQAAARGRELAAPHSEEVRSEVERVMHKFEDEHALADGFLRTESLFLSDTLVLGSWTPDTWGAETAASIERPHRLWLSTSIAMALQQSAVAKVPLVFRGAIAAGAFLIDRNLILGQAVDDAAELMDEANAAIVWYAPPGFSDPIEHRYAHYLDYDVPLKDGRTIRAQAVNPFAGVTDLARVDAVHDGMLHAFDGERKLDVVIKRQNTEAFLTAAREQWLAALKSAHVAEIINARPPT